MRINGYTRLAAVVARPIKHSISPFIHNLAFEETGINGVYVALDITEEDLGVTVENVKRYDMWGINISMPYKQSVLEYMDELTPAAAIIGAVNTVINKDGKLIGHNTDGMGFFKSLEFLKKFEIKGKEMTILGGGGASIAIISQAALDGVSSINVFTRNSSLERVSKRVSLIAAETNTEINVYQLEDQDCLQKKINKSDLLVNGTSVGMDGKSMIINDTIIFNENIIVADVIYQPFETPLLTLAKSQGIETVNGLGMLLFQAAEAFESWTDQKMPIKEIWGKLEEKYK